MRFVLTIIVSMVAATAQAFAATPDRVPSQRSFNPIIGEYVLTTGPEDFRQAWCELSDLLNYGQLSAVEKTIVLQLRGRASYELIGEAEFECRPEWQRVRRGEVGKVETENSTPIVSELPPALSEAVLISEPDWLAVFCAATSALNHNYLDAQMKAIILQLRGRASLELGDRAAIPRECGAKGLVTETL